MLEFCLDVAIVATLTYIAVRYNLFSKLKNKLMK